MCACNNDKISFCAAGYLLQRLFKRQAEHNIGSGIPQLLCVFFAVVYRKDRQTQQPGKPYRCSCHMTTAADDQLRHCTKALHKYMLPLDQLYTRGGAALQSGQISAHKVSRACLPYRFTRLQKQLTAGNAAVQQGRQCPAA